MTGTSGTDPAATEAPGESAPPSFDRRTALALGALLLARAVAGAFVAARIGTTCVDDYFRVFHALRWWEHPALANSSIWLPGHAWVYGTAIGLTHSTRWTPVLVSLALHLASAAMLAACPRIPWRERALAATWWLVTPLGLWLASVPLSESLFVALLLGATLAAGRYLDAERPGWLAGALVLASLAATVRYDGWIHLLGFGGLALVRTRVDLRARLALAPIVGVWPLTWIGWTFAREGEPLAFLRAVETDQFGSGDLLAALSGCGLVPLATWVLGVIAVYLVAPQIRRSRHMAFVYALLALSAAYLVVALVSGNVPSQMPLRMLYPSTALMAWPVARALARVPTPTIAAGAAALAALGIVQALSLPDVLPADTRAAADALAARLDDADLDPAAHAVVDGPYPELAAVVVLADAPGRVHGEGVGRACPTRVLACELPCGRPAWIDHARVAVVGHTIPAGAGGGWVRAERAGRWVVFERAAHAPPPCGPE